MKVIWKIAKAELQAMFYSPVAWLILIIFTFQVGMVYTGLFDGLMRAVTMGYIKVNVPMSQTLNIWSSATGVFNQVLSYLYLYVPLLTMGVISRELSTGSIKMLYSSPVTTNQIIFGKYLSLLVYGLILMGVLTVFGLHSAISIKNIDFSVILCGILGIFLLFCTYAAIGLFMSSLTSYTVVSAMGTLALLAVLSYTRTLWQDVEGVRELTHWLSISGRVDSFVLGMITTDRMIYFVLISVMFITFTAIRLNSMRHKSSFLVSFSKYAMVLVAVFGLGYLTSMPLFKGYYDVTRTKVNTLTKSSQDVLSRLGNDDLTITAYANMLDKNFFYGLPAMYMFERQLFEQYTRFKPRIKMKTERYYELVANPMMDKQYPNMTGKQRMDTTAKLMNLNFPIKPYEEIKQQVDLSGEKFRFVRLLQKGDGKQTFLRIFEDNQVMPTEREITAAFKRLVMDLPTVGFVTGHGERQSTSFQDRGYNLIVQEKSFRYALINQGFDVKDFTLANEVPDDIRILIIAEPRSAFSQEELDRISRYVEKGGNMIVLGEPESRDRVNPIIAPLGVQLEPGVLVKPSAKYQTDLLMAKPTAAGVSASMYLDDLKKRAGVVTMPGASPLSVKPAQGFESTVWLTSDSTGSWNELETTNFIDDKAVLNEGAGEKSEPFPTTVALSRKVNGKTQKIIVTGDADWISNGELGAQRYELPASNFNLILASFYWLSDNEVPIDMSRPDPTDTTATTSAGVWTAFKIFLKWILPVGLLAFSLLLYIKRRGK
ncbi:ABC transporter permease subunit [Pseudoflavitalea sp. G-6-1-2]|uniref:Gldg family protein n=1 Tax=Pseudoflavitalea sp. G-6-1-2 TaxID=2728841 RepID=UPI00146F8093|nr:Gldg family protein [Pseudoflavitalea sp. G-6-1-2]NML22270.1 ABC transporter permease subunit [Pseudoflavitalea sp. G-6-1-2]